MKFSSCLFLATLATVCLGSYASDEPPAKLIEGQAIVERVVADWEARRAAMPSAIKVVFEGNALAPKGCRNFGVGGERKDFPTEDHSYPVRTSLCIDFRRTRVRRESKRDQIFQSECFKPIERIGLFDGTRFQVLHLRREGRDPRKDERGQEFLDPGYDLELQTDRKNMFFFGDSDFPFFTGAFLISSMVPKSLVNPLRTTGLAFHGQVELEGRSYVVLRSPPDSNGGSAEVYADLERQSAIRRLIVWAPDNTEAQRIDILSYELIENLWVPKEWSFSKFEAGRLSFRERCATSEVVFRPELRDDIFFVNPKPGMVVFDVATNRVYEIKSWMSKRSSLFVFGGTLGIVIAAVIYLKKRRI